MDAVFLNLVNISITASYIAIAVTVFRFLLKKAPKKYTCILWLLVALRLILPVSDITWFSFTSRFSLIPETEVLPKDLINPASPQFHVQIGIDAIDRNINNYLDNRYSEGVTVPSDTGERLMTVFGCIWIAVFTAILLYSIGSYIYFRKKTMASIHVKENIFICDYISTPFILGMVRPRILLPSALSEEESQYILAHEKAHLKRLDYVWKPIGLLLLAVHWFNPIMWISYILFCRDIELACDEYVIKNMNAEDKKTYSTVLLKFSIPKKLLSAYPLAFGEIGVKKRIKAVLKYKKPAVITSILAVILCIVTALCFLANPKKTTLIEEFDELQSSDIYSIDFDDGNVFSTTENESYIETIMDELNEIEMGRIPFKTTNYNVEYKTIVLYDSDSKSYESIDESDKYWEFNFNSECNEVWIGDGKNFSAIYKIYNPEKVLKLFESIEKNNNIKSNPYKKYVYSDSENELTQPRIILFEQDHSFQFLYSLLSSYLNWGYYEIKDDNLILRTDDGKYIYSFKIEESGLIFDAENSTELPEYKYSFDEDAKAPVPDGAFFELINMN